MWTGTYRALEDPPPRLTIKRSESYASVTSFEAKKPPRGLKWRLEEHTAAHRDPGLHLTALWESMALLISAETIFNNVWSKSDGGWRNPTLLLNLHVGVYAVTYFILSPPICPSHGHSSFQGLSFTEEIHFNDNVKWLKPHDVLPMSPGNSWSQAPFLRGTTFPPGVGANFCRSHSLGSTFLRNARRAQKMWPPQGSVRKAIFLLPIWRGGLPCAALAQNLS